MSPETFDRIDHEFQNAWTRQLFSVPTTIEWLRDAKNCYRIHDNQLVPVMQVLISASPTFFASELLEWKSRVGNHMEL